MRMLHSMRLMNGTAYAYLRVSGIGQVDGDGFTRQLEAIQRHSATQGIEILKVYRDEGVSGTRELTDRPALVDLLLAIEDGDVRIVYIERLDRLARDLMTQQNILRDLKRKEITIISVAEPDLCSDDPSRVLMRQIFGAIAEYDRRMIVLKLRGARQRMKARTGRCEGAKAFGHAEGHQATIERIRSLRAAGMAVDKIALALNVEGLVSKSGGKWYGSSVRNVLLRNERAA